MYQFSVTLIYVPFLQIIKERFHNTIVDQQADKNDSSEDSKHNTKDKNFIFPNFIIIELFGTILFDHISSDQT